MRLYPLRINCPNCKNEATTTDVMVSDGGIIRLEAQCTTCNVGVHADFTLIEILEAIAGERKTSGINDGVN